MVTMEMKKQVQRVTDVLDLATFTINQDRFVATDHDALLKVLRYRTAPDQSCKNDSGTIVVFQTTPYGVETVDDVARSWVAHGRVTMYFVFNEAGTTVIRAFVPEHIADSVRKNWPEAEITTFDSPMGRSWPRPANRC